MRFTWNDKRARFPFNNRGDAHMFDQIGNWFSAGGLAPYLMGGGAKGMKGDEPPAPPDAPDPSKAADDALAAQTSQRRSLLASGGQTKYAGGESMLLGSDITTLNLGGA